MKYIITCREQLLCVKKRTVNIFVTVFLVRGFFLS